MSILLRYHFQPGESQRFRCQTSLVLREEEGVGGRTLHDLELKCLEAAPAGGWVMQLARKLTQSSGSLVPPDSTDQALRFRLAPDGRVEDLGQGAPRRFPRLPEGPVDVGASWNVDDVVYRLLRVEDGKVELQLTSVGMDGTAWFSTTHGKLFASDTVLVVEDRPGRTLETVIQLKMLPAS